MVVLKIDNLDIGYNMPIVRNIDINIKSPAIIQIIGPNGAGKTTLLKTLIGILKPLKGRILVDSIDITSNPEKAGRVISYVPQITVYVLGNVFPITVWEFIEFEAKSYAKELGLRNKDIVKLIENILNLVGIPRDLWNKGINKLSGGQRQRLLIARALIKNTPIVIMDEPLSAVDIDGRATISGIISKLKNEDKIIIVSCHDPSMFMKYTDFVMLMANGSYIFGKPNEVLNPYILGKIYRECYIEFKDHIHLYDYHI